MNILLTETKDPEKAQAALSQMDKLSEEWALKLHEAEKAIKAIEANAGDDVLASILNGNDGADDAVANLAGARAQYDIAQKTLASIERHQIIAKANLKLSRAHQMRLQAAEKGKERDAHMVKVNALLAELKELEGGADYVPFRPLPNPPGVYSDPVRHAIPLSAVMDGEIKELLYQAEQLESSSNATLAKVNAKAQAALSLQGARVLQPA